MLDEALKKQIQSAYSQFLEKKQLKSRHSQKLMIAEISRNISAIADEDAIDQRVSIIEASTGTGKTLAYLIPTIALAQAKEKKVVVVTATIALQEQLINKDIPEILALTDYQFDFALAKGRGRYLCLHHLAKYLSGQPSNQMSLDLNYVFDAKQTLNIDLYTKMDKQWKNGQWNGELDSWPDQVPMRDWRPVTCDHHSCLNKKCSFFNDCVFFDARKSVAESDLIVANYDLLFADLEFGGGVVLPQVNDSILIFDEAQHLPHKALQYMQFGWQIKTTELWLINAIEQIKTNFPSDVLSTLAKLVDKRLVKCEEIVEGLQQSVDDLYQSVSAQIEFSEDSDSKPSHCFVDGQVPQDILQAMSDAEPLFNSLQQLFDSLLDLLDDNKDINNELIAPFEQILQNALMRVDGAKMVCRQMHEGKGFSLDNIPIAKWLRYIPENTENKQIADYHFNTSPVLASERLYQRLWQQCYAAVVVSATIAVNGDFSLFQQEAGIKGKTMSLPSPFNYPELVDFYAPPMTYEPSDDAQSYYQEICDFLNQHILLNEGTLVLFSSKKQLESVEFSLFRKNKKWRDLILSQMNIAKQELIKRHKSAIDDGKGSIIFGLASFSEGVDLPGNYCKTVIICRLPFSMPDAPIDRTRSAWLESQNKRPFFELTVPQATIRLIQACGRLIRTESDTGRIILLDKRVFTKRYGQQILAALPAYRYHINQPIPR